MSLVHAQQRIELKHTALEYRNSHQREFAPDWYDWQTELFRLGQTHTERLVLAGNRSGKTLSAAYEFSLHITGDYPDDWDGLRINHAGTYWCLGVDNTQVRDVLQQELFGRIEEEKFTGGWVHPDEVTYPVVRSQTPGLAKDVYVKHKSGGKSHVSFKTYTQSSTGQASLPMAGSSVDGILVDEQPPDSITGQLKTRTMTGRRGAGGFMLYSMTPELGETELICQFMHTPAPHQALIGPIAWSQCPHLTPEKQAEFLGSIPPHEREMRSLGVPFFGSGRVYGVPEERLLVDPFDLSTRPWMRCIRAIDLGIGHPTSVAWLAFDSEQDITYLVKTYRQADEKAAYHAAAANGLWPNAPLVFPPDIDNREKGSGETVLTYYEQAGIHNGVMFENHDGSRYVEPGIMAIQEAEQAGKFKIFRGCCNEYLEERRTYHRNQKGLIVKERDDTMDAVRYGYQMVGTHGVKAENRRRQAYDTVPNLGLRRISLRSPRVGDR